MKKKRFLKKLLDSKKFTFFLSFVVAVILWSIVVTNISTDMEQRIRGVEINFNYNQSAYQNLGLEIIETDAVKVDVIVVGPRSEVGSLTAADVIVYPNVSSVRDVGKYTLPLNVVKTSSVKKFQIDDLNRTQINVRFDRIIEKEFSITIDVPNLTIPDEYMLDAITLSPDKLVVSGPEATVNAIASVVATVKEETLTQSAQLPVSIKLYDENDAPIDETYIEYDSENIVMTVPVLKEVELPIKIGFINVPQGFNTDTLKLSMAPEKIKLAVPSKLADSLTEFVVGYIDLKTLNLNTAYSFDIKVPNGYKNLSEIERVTASITNSNIVTRNVAVSEIKLINNGGHNIEVLTQAINNVVIVGEADVVEELSSGSVIAQIDLAKISIAQGQQTVEVEIIIPSTGKAYAMGTYTATIRN